jgi:hypothetical protein
MGIFSCCVSRVKYRRGEFSEAGAVPQQPLNNGLKTPSLRFP